jgi:hypothetical protein
MQKIMIGRACSEDGARRGVYRDLVVDLRERDHWEDPGIDGRIILPCIFR